MQQPTMDDRIASTALDILTQSEEAAFAAWHGYSGDSFAEWNTLRLVWRAAMAARVAQENIIWPRPQGAVEPRPCISS